MNSRKTSILVLDDEPELLEEICEFLHSMNFKTLKATTPGEAFRILSGEPVDIAILDIRLPEMNGLEFLKELRRMYPEVQAIMMSGHGDMNSVIQALRSGAVDYFQKPFLLNEMLQTIQKARKYLSRRTAREDQKNFVLSEGSGSGTSASMVVVSAAMKAAVEQMRLVARSKDTTVLITGESGTGKELIAHGIHYLSPRKDKVFHAVNCSTIPDELFESEFFGYKKGAFTGANTDKAGWFEAADGGTLFLDEIGDLKLSLQAKLLRIMEDKRVSRLGSTVMKKVDVRIVAATNQNLERLIRENRFRQDLYHRINTFVINVPPLRQRPDSIPHLFSYYLDHYSKKLGRPLPGIDHEIIEALQHYDFPGNVRELKHMIERALILCEGDMLTSLHFDHLKIKTIKNEAGRTQFKAPGSLGNIEKESIEAALRQSGNNKSQAARILNISRQALDRKMEKLGIVVSR